MQRRLREGCRDVKALTVETYLQNSKDYCLIDVRSPGEYGEAHIPGAVNVPLFTDAERVQVGIAYKQEGTDRAKQVGLRFVAARLPQMVEQILAAAGEKKIVFYCWRGGMRSRSMSYLLAALNYPVYQLTGGYKAFRRHINRFHETYNIKVPVFVLNGLTGVGKTQMLALLAGRGIPVLDLESMANHRGSAFGSVGLGAPRSQKDFDALLAVALMERKDAHCLVVEGEGKRIGPVHLPEYLFAAMEKGPHILLVADLNVRVERIVSEYRGHGDTAAELATAIYGLQKKLGKAKCDALADKIQRRLYAEVVLELCRGYYDLYYRDSRRAREDYLAIVNVNDLERGADEVAAVITAYLDGRNACGGEHTTCM
ncbi:MAG TPA: tRNA 2-selenouridine(34) synthase MnmH [Firmicutes bacterium]|nr:tRNA 2-selenouridine(34) synthase MnmH [Bacillota bacterium]